MVYKNNTKAVEHKPVEAVSDPRKCTISDKMKKDTTKTYHFR